MVMTARLALGDDNVPRNNYVDTQADSPLEIYQKALKFLQDPILPVRAHGLLLLRQLASASTDSAKMDPALVPAVLEIFVQAIQDDDSYIFLNGVQGLAALVDNYDRSILKRLVYDYTKHLDGLEAGNMTQQDVDTRIRLGEALSMVIRRCGETLGAAGGLFLDTVSWILALMLFHQGMSLSHLCSVWYAHVPRPLRCALHLCLC